MKKSKTLSLILSYLLLLIFAIPWYWPASNTEQILGMPIWVVLVLVVGFCASILTAWNLLHDPVDVNSKNNKD